MEELEEKIKLYEHKLDVQIQTALAKGHTDKDINKFLGNLALFINPKGNQNQGANYKISQSPERRTQELNEDLHTDQGNRSRIPKQIKINGK